MELLEQIKIKLKDKNVYELRQIGRAVGVNLPTTKKRDELIEDILNIASAKTAPCQPSRRGAPPKSQTCDNELVEEINKCREYFLEGASKLEDEPENTDEIAAVEEKEDGETYSGVLEFSDKYWFVRTQNMQISSTEDVFMHLSFVNKYHLREGDKIVCKAKRRRPNECPGVIYIVSVNGKAPSFNRPTPFEKLTPYYPDRRITLEREGCTLTDRVIDLFSPIGFGQRALIVSPPKAGKTTMLKDIARSIRHNHPQALVVVLLIDERPEEVTDFCRTVEGAEVIYSTFDKGDNHHTQVASLTLSYAKRQVEEGKDVVILLDSITRLTRAYNALSNSGRTLSGGLDPQAIVEPKRFFGSARNIEGGGSLTIIATALVDTGSRLDDIIYEEFKSTGNMEITLSRSMAERRIFPAIDVRLSGARKEELLLSEEELKASAAIRSLLSKNLSEEELYSSMNKTENNAQFCAKSQAFVKVYNGR
ncbi:MAG: transcription termination factor Rho [Candidatus Coproplasma sp.]